MAFITRALSNKSRFERVQKQDSPRLHLTDCFLNGFSCRPLEPFPWETYAVRDGSIYWTLVQQQSAVSTVQLALWQKRAVAKASRVARHYSCNGLKQQIRVGSRGRHSQHRTGSAPHNPLGDTAAHRVDHVLFDYPQSARVSMIQYP